MKNEKKFLKPEAKVVEFYDEDIILTSNGLGSEDVEEVIEL